MSSTTNVNWEKFYARLATLTVSLPTPGDGEVINPAEIASLMLRVQSKRDAADQLYQKLTRLLAETKRRLDTLDHTLRVERCSLQEDATLIPDSVKGDNRRARIEWMTSNTSGTIALLKARKSELELARDGVATRIKTLETAKETLNAVRSLISPSAFGGGYSGRR